MNGWSMGTILTAQTGLPFSVALSNNQSNSLVSAGGGLDRPN
jgi:hypothetical protein